MTTKKITALIPARYAATRFHGKLMAKLGEKSVIMHVLDNTTETGLFDEVIVVTDSEIISEEILKHGGKVLHSEFHHETGTDRIAEVVNFIKGDIIVNVQGDVPFVQKEPLMQLLKSFEDPEVEVASLMQVINNADYINDPNFVKVTVNKKSDALLFSRSVIPFRIELHSQPIYYEHIGIYGFRRNALINFSEWPMSPLELTEKIEALRFLENGIAIRMGLVDFANIQIDTYDDLVRCRNIYMVSKGN